MRLHETYTITTSSPFILPLPVDVWNITDEFDTFNNVYGVQLGVRGRYDWGRFFASDSLKFAMGAMVFASFTFLYTNTSSGPQTSGSSRPAQYALSVGTPAVTPLALSPAATCGDRVHERAGERSQDTDESVLPAGGGHGKQTQGGR